MILLRSICCIGTACIAPAVHGTDITVWHDPAGDAVIRRTDPTNSGPLNPLSKLPDIAKATLSGWNSPTASTNPYSGYVQEELPPLFRLQLTFSGLVNPPGVVEQVGFDPFQFGNSPLYGFFELDVDRNHGTGGELGAAAKHRYLANVGRFGRMPNGSLGVERGVRWGTQLDGVYSTTPQYERSGTDFALVFCGCHATTIESQSGNGNGIFEAGETWVVSGYFWQRSGGYRLASFMTGGPQPGLWQPLTKLQWSHDIMTNQTTVTLVGAVRMSGAAQLAGAATQQPNYSYGGADHTSVQEALLDLVDFANFNPPLPGTPEYDLSIQWQGEQIDENMLDPTRWEGTGIFATSYAVHQPGAPYVWTDSGFEDVLGDMNCDEFANSADRLLVRQAIAAEDGGSRDADGVVNGSVQIAGFGANFAVFDHNGDGKIDTLDSVWYCRTDVNDDLALNVADFGAFLTVLVAGSPLADINRDGALNVADYAAFLDYFAAGCP